MTAAVGFGVGVALAFAMPRLVGGDDESVGVALLSSAGLWAGLVGACAVVSLRRGTRSLVRDFAFRFRWIDLGLGFAGSIAARLLLAMAILPIPLPTRRLRDLGPSPLPDEAPAGWELGVLVLIVCVGAPLFEEVFFRGLVQPRLVDRFGVVPGIVVASVLFGAAHMIGWAGAISVATAWAIWAHVFFNAQAMAALLLLS